METSDIILLGGVAAITLAYYNKNKNKRAIVLNDNTVLTPSKQSLSISDLLNKDGGIKSIFNTHQESFDSVMAKENLATSINRQAVFFDTFFVPYDSLVNKQSFT